VVYWGQQDDNIRCECTLFFDRQHLSYDVCLEVRVKIIRILLEIVIGQEIPN